MRDLSGLTNQQLAQAIRFVQALQDRAVREEPGDAEMLAKWADALREERLWRAIRREVGLTA